jgi:hypothetical protein
MKIHCQLTPNDYIKAQFLHMRPRPVFGWIGILILVAMLATCILQLIFPISGKMTWSPFVLLGVLAYFAFVYGVFLPLRAKRIFRQQKALHEPYEVELTDEALSSMSAYGDFKMEWSAFHKYKTSKNLILVYQSDAIFHMFPRRWFTESQFTEFHAILKKQLGRPKA